MTRVRECSRPRWSLQAIPLLAAALLGLGASARAQAVTASRDADLLGEPRGAAIGTLRNGATVRRHESRSGYTRVIVEGFVEGASLGGKKGRYQVSVKAAKGTSLRGAAASGSPVQAHLEAGVGLALVVRSGAWVKVRRGGWVATSTFFSADAGATARAAAPARGAATSAASMAASVAASVAAPVAAPPTTSPPTARIPDAADSPTGSAASSSPLPEGGLVPGKALELRLHPDGGSMATIRPGSVLTPLARERGWVRVRIEGWVPEAEVAPADTSLRAGLSAADLRADPLGTRGRVVRWEVEVIAFHIADPLRRDLSNDEPYLLARGPAKENALMYLALPPSLVTAAKALPPLSRIIITARVRTGRSDPIGVPVLDVMTMAKR